MTLSLYEFEIEKDGKPHQIGKPLSFLTTEQIAFLPELIKADKLLEGFDWRKLNTQETNKDLSTSSEGLNEIIKRLNGQDVDAAGCFKWIVDNFHELIEVIEKMPLQKNKDITNITIRQITENWQISMDS